MENLIQKIQPMVFEKIKLLAKFYPDLELEDLASIVQNDFVKILDDLSEEECLNIISEMKDDLDRPIERMWKRIIIKDVFLYENIILIRKEILLLLDMVEEHFN